ncbi:unnamed protein product [Acanthoscelides obtectus]|uniref:Uncharacterized protein n=1 Tax=Acanthoscelides obtectus TaxID=200917 RepID=A0A9P0NVB4_ACAOB|nr:unnamed protein product [Acanthoscelides obtectus]CAK1621934.1 hypothetical protein AOBTE_LOCUS1222 [Acanthoscelides obtectus]
MRVFKLVSVYSLLMVGIVSANWEGEESLKAQRLEGPIEFLINTTLNTIIKTVPDPLNINKTINLVFNNQTLLE